MASTGADNSDEELYAKYPIDFRSRLAKASLESQSRAHKDLEERQKLPWIERLSMYFAKYPELERRRKELEWLQWRKRTFRRYLAKSSPQESSSSDEWDSEHEWRRRGGFEKRWHSRRRQSRNGESVEGDSEEEYKALTRWEDKRLEVVDQRRYYECLIEKRSELQGKHFDGFMYLPVEIRFMIFELCLVVGKIFVPNTLQRPEIWPPELDAPPRDHIVRFILYPNLYSSEKVARPRYLDFIKV